MNDKLGAHSRHRVRHLEDLQASSLFPPGVRYTNRWSRTTSRTSRSSSSLRVAANKAGDELAFIPITDTILKPLTLALCLSSTRQLSAAANLFLARIEGVIAADGN